MHYRESEGVLVINPMLLSNKRQFADLALATLEAMGKDLRLNTMIRNAISMAGAWLAGGQYKDAIILDAGDFEIALVPEVAAWFAWAGVRPWFVVADTIGETAAEDFAAALGDPVPLQSFWKTFDSLPTRPLLDALEDPKCQGFAISVPRVDGLFFRSAARRLLSTEEFEAVDALFVGVVKEMAPVIAAFGDTDASAEVEEIVWDRVRHAPSTDELLISVRAAQVACLYGGYQLSVHTATLLGAAEALPRSGLAAPQDWWRRLAAYRDPDPGALAALYAAGANAATAATIALGDVVFEDDRAIVQVGQETVIFEGDVAVFFRVLCAFRSLGGASAGDPLFVTHRAPSLSEVHGRRLLRFATSELGIDLFDESTAFDHLSTTQLLERYGVRVQRLFRVLGR